MQKKTDSIIVIPDVHGRSFWRDAVKQRGDLEVVFLGDYVDPYYGISDNEALAELRDIVSLKEKYPDKISLLLGNHDLHYVISELGRSRYSSSNAAAYKDIFGSHRELFSLAIKRSIEDVVYIFSHAGIHPRWFYRACSLFGLETYESFPSGLQEADLDYLNRLWREGKDDLLSQHLMSRSGLRGGWDRVGSMVWADVREYVDWYQDTPGLVQVFGHTQLDAPFFGNGFACLDSKLGKSYRISKDITTFPR